MQLDDIAFLISAISNGRDEIGQLLPVTLTRNETYCTKKSISQNEFYKAAQSDLKPQFVLEISAFDYNSEDLVEYNGTMYQIYRTYERPDEIIELYCEMRSGNG